MSNKSDSKLKGRDVIYVDIDDDITSIVEKVNKSENSVVALVPPKRIGALQSVVNLKLLLQSAKTKRKKIAIVTTDPALSSLAAGLKIPVARNLTAQAEILDASDDEEIDEDIINGDEVTIGELAQLSDAEKITRRDNKEDKEISAAVAAIENDDKVKNDRDADGEPDDKQKKAVKKKRPPNFNKFRKWLLIGGGGAVLLIVFLIWAIGFAPRATITIETETTAVSIDEIVSLQPSVATNIEENVIQPVVQTMRRTETLEFDATGERETGEHARGTVNIYVAQGDLPRTFAAGTQLATTSGDLRFTIDSAVTVAPASDLSNVVSCGGVLCAVASASVTAVNIGESSNISGGTQLTVAGGVSADAVGNFAGGSRQTVRVVQQSDVDAAVEELKQRANDNRDQVRRDLQQQMGDSVTIIRESFSVSFSAASSRPAVNETVNDGRASVTIEAVYTLIGISNSDLEDWLTEQINIEAEVSDENPQQIYNTGIDQIRIRDFATAPNGYSIRISTDGARIGAVIDKEKIKENAVGKKSGVIVADVERLPGVDSVRVQISPFWVTNAPRVERITVNFITDEQ